MRWTNLSADLPQLSLSDLCRTLSAVDALALVASLRTSPVVLFSPECREGVRCHLLSDRTELGGLLIGRASLPPPALPEIAGPLISIEDFVPSRRFRSSRTSLSMETEIWGRARQRMAGHTITVGWYHSHPDLGAFFSQTDRATQRAFFNAPYSVALVIDPIRNEEAWFVGAESSRLSHYAIVAARLDDSRRTECHNRRSSNEVPPCG